MTQEGGGGGARPGASRCLRHMRLNAMRERSNVIIQTCRTCQRIKEVFAVDEFILYENLRHMEHCSGDEAPSSLKRT